MISCLSNPVELDWAEWTTEADLACNTATPHHSFFLEHGRKPYTPVNIMAGVFMPSVEQRTKLVPDNQSAELAASLEGCTRRAYVG